MTKEISNTAETPKEKPFINCGMLFLIGIILVVVTMFIGFQFIKSRISASPEKALNISHQIMDYDIPGGSKGVASLELNGKLAVVQGIVESPKITVMLAATPIASSSEFKLVLDRHARAMAKDKNILIDKTEMVTEEICGQKIKVPVQQSRLKTNGQDIPMTTIRLYLKNKETGIFAIIMSEGSGHYESALHVLKSLKCKQ